MAISSAIVKPPTGPALNPHVPHPHEIKNPGNPSTVPMIGA